MNILSIFILTKFKPFVFNNSCPRSFCISIIYCCISLEIRNIQNFIFKFYTSVFKRTKLIVKISVNCAGIHNFISNFIKFFIILKIIYAKLYFNSVKHIFNHFCIPSNRYTLIQRIKIIVVKCQTYRQAFNNKSWQFFTFSSPLLFSISLYKFFINISSNQTYCLFFQIFRFTFNFFTLFINFCSSFLGSYHTPHFIKCIHVERQRVKLTLIVCNR